MKYSCRQKTRLSNAVSPEELLPLPFRRIYPGPETDIEGPQDLLGCQVEWMKIEECSAASNCCSR